MSCINYSLQNATLVVYKVSRIPTESDTKAVLALNMYVEPVEIALGWAAKTPDDQRNVDQREQKQYTVFRCCTFLR